MYYVKGGGPPLFITILHRGVIKLNLNISVLDEKSSEFHIFHVFREGVKIGHFTVRLTVRGGGGGGAAPLVLTVSKCENFDPLKRA